MVSCESNTAWICKIKEKHLWLAVENMCKSIVGEKSTRMHPPKITSYRREPDSAGYAEEEKKVKQKHLSPLRRRLSNRWKIAINHAFKKVRGWSKKTVSWMEGCNCTINFCCRPGVVTDLIQIRTVGWSFLNPDRHHETTILMLITSRIYRFYCFSLGYSSCPISPCKGRLSSSRYGHWFIGWFSLFCLRG